MGTRKRVGVRITKAKIAGAGLGGPAYVRHPSGTASPPQRYRITASPAPCLAKIDLQRTSEGFLDLPLCSALSVGGEKHPEEVIHGTTVKKGATVIKTPDRVRLFDDLHDVS